MFKKNLEVDENKLAVSLFNQASELWIIPEIERRINLGTLTKDFKFHSAQVIFSVEGATEVRFNNEVRGILSAKVNKSVNKGSVVFGTDITDIESVRLLNDDIDFGHITIISVVGGTFLSFSFIYDITKSKRYLEVGTEFLQSAYQSKKAKRYRSMIEDLSISAENLAKARLMTIPDKEIRLAKTHKTISNKVNIYARNSSMINEEYKNAFNRLMTIRDKARYDIDFFLEDIEANDLFKHIKRFKDELSLFLVQSGAYP